MALIFTLLYVALSLLSPSVLPMAIVMLHVNIILGVLAILACIPQVASSRIGTIPETYLVLGLFFSAGLSIALNTGFAPVAGVLMQYFPVFVAYYFVAIACRSIAHLKTLVTVMFFVAMFIFAQGAIADHSGMITSPYLEPEGSALLGNLIYRYKGLGVLSDPNDTAQFYCTLIPLMFLRWKKGSTLPNFVFTILPVCLLMAGMFYTHSRGGIVALLALTLFGFKDKLGLIKSAILAGLLFAASMALNVSGGRGMDNDDGGRVAAWSTGLEVFRAHPIVGVGIDRFMEFNDTGHTAHNSYVLCLAELGLIGYFCWMGTIVTNFSAISAVATVTRKPKKKRSEPPPRFMPQRQEPAPIALAPQPAVAMAAAPTYPRMVYPGMAAPPVEIPLNAPSQAALEETPPHLRYVAPPDREDEAIATAASVVRISMVGMLTAAFLLSRTFAMLFYIVIGMSAATRLLYARRHPGWSIQYGPLFRKIGIALFCSVLFLYIFIRVRGIH
jgi:O-antigen ligase